jgi:hypothetical protein
VTGRAHTIELVESELVGERGTRRVSWRVARADGWLAAAAWPGARSERLDPGPGTVWETRIELDLPAGTRLERVESAPVPAERRDPLDYLSAETRRARRRTRRTAYQVSPRGELVPARGA